jgi:transposase
MPPAYVKAYVKRNKNDAADAAAFRVNAAHIMAMIRMMAMRGPRESKL